MGLATDRLARTIDNLVNFATFEGGGHAVHREPFDLQALLKAVLEGERLKAKSRRIHLDVKVETLEQGSATTASCGRRSPNSSTTPSSSARTGARSLCA